MGASRAKISLISTPGGRKRVYNAALGNFFKFQISCPNIEILKPGPYLANGCP